MEPTATCEVIVRKPNGEPLPNAEVKMWPRYNWLRGHQHQTVLGSSRSSPEILRRARAGDAGAPSDRTHPFSSITNDQGVAVIANLHGRQDIELHLSHNDFELPLLNGLRPREVSLEPGEKTTIALRMQPRSSAGGKG
jgi:hypothetical protein